jgi:hypothetical protein
MPPPGIGSAAPVGAEASMCAASRTSPLTTSDRKTNPIGLRGPRRAAGVAYNFPGYMAAPPPVSAPQYPYAGYLPAAYPSAGYPNATGYGANPHGNSPLGGDE